MEWKVEVKMPREGYRDRHFDKNGADRRSENAAESGGAAA